MDSKASNGIKEVSTLSKLKENWYIILVVIIFLFMFGYGIYNNIRQRPAAPATQAPPEEISDEMMLTDEATPAAGAEDATESADSTESAGTEEATDSGVEELELPPELMER